MSVKFQLIFNFAKLFCDLYRRQVGTGVVWDLQSRSIGLTRAIDDLVRRGEVAHLVVLY